MYRALIIAAGLVLCAPAYACPGGSYEFNGGCQSLDSLTSDDGGTTVAPIAPIDHDPYQSGPLADGTHYTEWSPDDHFDENGNPAPMDQHGWDSQGNYHNIIGDGIPMDSLDDNDNGFYDPEEQ